RVGVFQDVRLAIGALNDHRGRTAAIHVDRVVEAEVERESTQLGAVEARAVRGATVDRHQIHVLAVLEQTDHRAGILGGGGGVDLRADVHAVLHRIPGTRHGVIDTSEVGGAAGGERRLVLRRQQQVNVAGLVGGHQVAVGDCQTVYILRVGRIRDAGTGEVTRVHRHLHPGG